MDSLLGSPSEELRKYQRLELPKSHRWFPALLGPFMERQNSTQGPGWEQKVSLGIQLAHNEIAVACQSHTCEK